MKLSLFFALLLFTGVANATDYYVSTSGNDSNNGTSQTTPWKTLSKVQSVCNNGTIKAGDNIFFKKGEVFTGSLLMASIWGYSAHSGTAAQPITFSAYGTGAKPVLQYPQGSSTTLTLRVIFWFVQVDYIVVDGLNFTDLVNTTNDKVSAANCGYAIYLGIPDEATTNHCTIKNVDISLCGMGVAITGDFNTISNSTLTNFKNLINTNNGGDDDYGANAVTILGSDNQITSNYISSAWAYSSDFGWNGGACEMYNTCNRNKIMYNTIVDCDGVSEFGGEGGTTANDNLFAYNKIINCGQLTWVNTVGTFAMQASNVQYFNNVVVENDQSRFSGPNVGAGNTHPLAHYPMSELYGFSGSPDATTVFNLKNNIYILSTGIDITRSSYATKTVHQDNIYQLSNSSVTNFTLATSELSTSAAILTNTSSTDPLSWNYTPATGSPAIDFGQNLGIPRDFAGNIVPSVPNAGILETGTAGAPTLVGSSSAIAINCNGGTTTVTVSATGGTSPYTGTGNFTVSAGTYSYTVTDATGTVTTTSITVTQPTAIVVTATAGTITIIGGSTAVTAGATGGTSPYTYSINGGTYQSSNIFSGILAGTHTITVKDSKGCTAVKTLGITQPGAPQLTASSTAGVIGCNGGSATVTVSATGGVSPYTGTGTFTKTAGTYNYTVTDAAGATATTSITLTQPTAINLVVTAGTITVNGGTTTIAANASGGTPNFTFKLNSGTYQSSGSFTNVPAGTHTITAKDKNGCTTSKTITITQPSNVTPLVVTATPGFIACNGGTTTVAVSASGGVAPYTGTGNFTASAGTRTYTVTDAAGTTSTKTLTIVQPKIILVTASAGTITTYGGSATVTVSASGGTGAYSYKLNSGTYQASNTFSNVVAGTYTVTVKDARNCTGTANLTITQPSPVFQTTLVLKTNVTCSGANNGTIQVAGNFGVTPYKFKKGSGNYSSTSLFTNLAPGTYTITGKDAVGAISSIQVTIANSTVACKMAGKGSSNETAPVNNDDALQVRGLEITAFPNPSNTQFSLIVKSDNDEPIHIMVMNMNGQKVYESTSTINKKNIFGNSFIPGIYFVKVVQGGHLQTIRLIKTK